MTDRQESNAFDGSLVFCDEHGNTGENLLDPDQPMFVLASNDFEHQEALNLLDILAGQGGQEVKFKTLCKSAAGRQRVARFLFDTRVAPNRIAAFIMDKRYMLFTKLVDLVMETLMDHIGVDLYKRGANIATANMLYACVPTFCGEAKTVAALEAFQQLVRHRTSHHVAAYETAGRSLIDACSDPFIADFLEPFFSRDAMPIWLDDLPSDVLDPAIPALFSIIDAWGRRKGARFEVVHDQSKPVLASHNTFMANMALLNEQSEMVGYDRRQFLFPLRASGLHLEPSHVRPQLQIADVCAGALAHFMKAKREGFSDEISDAIEQSDRLKWAVGGVVPSHEVTPETLGTTSQRGSNPIDPLVIRQLKNSRT